MRNLCIFVIYNNENRLMPYVEYLLSQLSSNVKDIYVAINGQLMHDELKKVYTYTKKVVQRDNSGYDVGAYRDIILNHLDKEDFNSYDEVILCNDTFYGFAEPLDNILNEMRNRKVDFWGLNYVEGEILDYLESYFLVFQHKDINKDLYSFFEKYNVGEIETVQDVCACFEVGLFHYLKRKGYLYGSFRKTDNYNVYRDPDICFIDFGLPVIKKKSLCEPYYDKKKIEKVLSCLEKTESPLRSFIVNSRLLSESVDKPTYKEVPITLKEDELLDFINKNKEVYIYGAGLMARKIWYMYRSVIADFKGFIVSDVSQYEGKKIHGYPVYGYHQLKSGKAIIIGLNYKNTMAVKKVIKELDLYITLWNL